MNNETDKWQLLHGRFIHSFLLLLNKQTDQFVLKGGTALSICYGLNRFSEGIDLDGRKQDIKEIVRRFSTQHNIKFRIAKDTPTVKRCLMDYGNPLHPLKIEVSYRNRDLDISEAAKDWTRINGINVYEKLSYPTRATIRDTLSYKGIKQFDYLVATQNDPLIDKDKLADGFLKMHEKLGLLMDQFPEKKKKDNERSR